MTIAQCEDGASLPIDNGGGGGMLWIMIADIAIGSIILVFATAIHSISYRDFYIDGWMWWGSINAAVSLDIFHKIIKAIITNTHHRRCAACSDVGGRECSIFVDASKGCRCNHG